MISILEGYRHITAAQLTRFCCNNTQVIFEQQPFMISQASRFKSSSATVLIRCPKDFYESCSKSKHLTKRDSSSKSKRVAASPSNRHIQTVRDENQDPYLLKRAAATQQPLESITILRRKQKNLEFLQSCLYAEIQKLQVSGTEPAQSNVKYQQSVTEYDTVISNSDQLAATIGVVESRLQQVQTYQTQHRQRLAMISADIESSYLQRAELLFQLEDSQQILVAYVDQFEEENQCVIKEIDIEQQLEHVEQNKKNIVAELELIQLQQRKLQEDQQTQQNRYFEQKANQLRVDLLEQQDFVNQVSKQLGKPTLRQLICSYYSTSDDSGKPQKDGLDVWLCKNQLVENFRDFVLKKQVYVRPQLSPIFKKYVDILCKIEIIFRKMQSSHHIQYRQKCKNDESDLMSQYNYWISNEQRLQADRQANRLKLSELFAQEKLYKLQSLDVNNSKMFAGTVQKLTLEQQRRITNIKFHKKRLIYLKEAVKIKSPREEHIRQTKQLSAKIKQYELELSSLKSQYLKCDRVRRQKESEFRSVKMSRLPSKREQDVEAISILYKKIERIRQKKINLKNQICLSQSEMMDCITPKTQTHRMNASKFSNHSRQQTTPSSSTTSLSLFKRLKTDAHPLEETIQKLQRLKDSISERTPLTAVYSRVIKF